MGGEPCIEYTQNPGLKLPQIFSGRLPYEEILTDELFLQRVVEQDVRPARPACLPEKHIVWKTIQECWAPNRKKRLTASRAEDHLNLVLETEGAGTST